MTKLSKLITTTALLGLTALPVAALDLSAGAGAGLSLGEKDAAVSAQADLGATADAVTTGGATGAASAGADVDAGASVGTDVAQSGAEVGAGATGSEATVPEASAQGTVTTAAKGDVVLSSDEAVIGTVDQVVPGPEGTQTLLVTLEPEVGAETEAARFSVNVTTDAAADGKVKLAMNKADLLGELNARAAGSSDG